MLRGETRPALEKQDCQLKWYKARVWDDIVYLTTSFAASSFMRCSTYSIARWCEMMMDGKLGKQSRNPIRQR
jgi:hypothetical protein